jgi:hypothetical protein
MSPNADNNDAEVVLRPFHESRQTRHAYLSRTNSLLTALNSTNAEATLLTLPNISGSDERRPTSTYIIRPLSTKEQATLLDPQQCNCRFETSNKANVQLMYRVAGNGEGSTMSNWDMSTSLKAQVHNNTFSGNVILGLLLDGPDSVELNNNKDTSRKLSNIIGISNNSLIQNSILEPGCSIHKNSEVISTHVMKYAAIIGCGSISYNQDDVAKSKSKYNFDMTLGSMDVEVGPEAGGGRVVNVAVENTLVDVCHALNMDSNGGTIAPLYQPSKENSSEVRGEVKMNVLCPHSSLLHTTQVQHVHVLPYASIDSATSVSSAILLPKSTIKSGSTVSHALLQWSSTITSQSDAHHVHLMECACVGPHSFTANTIYGPDSHVSGGEVHCTIFGPNANSHHQSLLIGILWPLGRGNVGYGSNVGSNHTGRIPDQETSVGEGTFWGLGCVIKFPVDMTCSPYTIVAAGVQLPPQRITMPFSLITDGPGGMNQLTPGWLLQYSPYTIARSEVKFANRRTAKRHDYYTGWKILRAGNMDLLVNARSSLVYAGQQKQSAGEKKVVVYKTDKSIPGLGANQLTEKGRQIGIKAYTDAIQRYALRGLLERLVSLVNKSQKSGLTLNQVLAHVGLEGVSEDSAAPSLGVPSKSVVNWPVLPWNEESHTSSEAVWKHQHSMLINELSSILSSTNKASSILSRILEKCVALEDDHAKRVYKSKSRDDTRGASTVPGYADVHIAAEKDSVVLAAKKEADDVRQDTKLIEAAIGGGVVARSRL